MLTYTSDLKRTKLKVNEFISTLGIISKEKTNPQSDVFWKSKVTFFFFGLMKNKVKEIVESRFSGCFNGILGSREINPFYDLRDSVDLKDLISRFSEMGGVTFSERVLNYQSGEYLKLFRYDVQQLKSRYYLLLLL